MTDQTRVQQVIYRAIDEVNMQLTADERVDKTPETLLLTEGGKLDSLTVVNLVVLVEELLEEEFDVTINIADQDVGSLGFNPFKSVATLTEYVAARLEETDD